MYDNTKFFLKISKMVNLQAFITMCHSSLSVFMTNKTPSGAKSIAKVPNQKVAKLPNVISFFLSSSSSSSYGLVQNCVMLP